MNLCRKACQLYLLKACDLALPEFRVGSVSFEPLGSGAIIICMDLDPAPDPSNNMQKS